MLNFGGAAPLQKEVVGAVRLPQTLTRCSCRASRGPALPYSRPSVTFTHSSKRIYAANRGGEGDQREQQTDAEQGKGVSSGSGESVSRNSILGIVNERKQLSIQQRYRTLILTLKSFARSNEFIQNVSSAVHRVLAPLVAKKVQMDRWFEAYLEDYEQYLAMETKERWSWEKRNRKEAELLHSIPPFVGMVFATLLYEVFIPCSVGCAVVLPLYFSWILYDRWYFSPVILGMLLIARWKSFHEIVAIAQSMQGSWCWIWPGVM
jgi:hypothetical protein